VAFALVLVACCSAPRGGGTTTAARGDTAPREAAVTETSGGAEATWTVVADEQDGDDTVSVTVGPDEGAGASPPESASRFGRGSAWLALGRQALEEGAVDVALSRAQRGLEVVGDDYASPMVDDDTDLKRFAAEDRVANGHRRDGAEVLLRVLDDRLALLADRDHLRLVVTR